MPTLTRDMAFPSKWLKAADVPPTGVDVTIEKVEQEDVDFGDGPKISTILTFTELPKPLSLNATNWDSIESLYGPNAYDWIGHVVRLFSTKARNPSGATVPAIRIMPPMGKPSTPAAPTDPKAAWGDFYRTLDQTQQANVNGILGGAPSAWMQKTGKDIHACIAYVKAAFKIGVEPTDQDDVNNIEF